MLKNFARAALGLIVLVGKLTVDHLKKATELEGSVIDIPDVAVDDRIVTVRIIAEPTYTVATADSGGNVL